MKALGLASLDYRLKRAQKCFIAQLRSMRVPDLQIAEMTGHTLDTYQKNYVKGSTYDRRDRWDYEEFGELSENGRYWVNEWRGGRWELIDSSPSENRTVTSPVTDGSE
jgi:hypothetical protein